MPAELFPLAAALSGGRLVPEIIIAVVINVGAPALPADGASALRSTSTTCVRSPLRCTFPPAGGTLACVAGLRWALRDVDNVPPSITAWPWEPEAWGFQKRDPATEGEQAPGEGGAGEEEHARAQGADGPPRLTAGGESDAAPASSDLCAPPPPTPHPGEPQKEE
jgi:hypothetical protein